MDSVDLRRQDRFWNQLLGTISRADVVPIVGEELLCITGNDGASLYETLAHRYANYCGLELNPAQQGDLSATVRNHPEFKDNPHDIYQEVSDEYEYLVPDIPAPLRALARIQHFNLFISTTFDNLLERAINEERFSGKQLTEVISYSPKNIPSDEQITKVLSSGRPVIFQIFGNYKTPLHYALTDGDVVEYMHALQSTEYCPKRIFSELYERPLLMLGNNFPDWLTRLFLRMTRKTSLDNREVPKQYFADASVTKDPLLNFFLRRFTTNTELVENMDPSTFIIELESRWGERFSGQEITSTCPTISAAKPMPKQAIFISYCASDAEGNQSEDTLMALAIRDALEALGMDVWIDKDQLQGGDEYERKIERYINTCSLFMPLISTTTESRDSGFFRKEWSWALKRLPGFTGSNRQFLFPIVIDDLDVYEAQIPDEFKRTHITKINTNPPDVKVLSSIQALYNKAHSEQESR